MIIETQRMRLIPATAELARAELFDRVAFARQLTAEVPDNWPPESAADALPWFLEQLLAAPRERYGWLAWYGVQRGTPADRFILVAGAGFKGPPHDGVVETGYSVLPQFQRQGFATEMVGALTQWALSQPGVECVIAQTGRDNIHSIRLLTKLGFVRRGIADYSADDRYELFAGPATAL